MKPTSQFQMMIMSLLENRQSSITNADLIKHQNNETAFYAVNKITIKNNTVSTTTLPFSDQTIIEISKGADILKVSLSERDSTDYRRTTPLQITPFQGQNLLHWEVEDNRRQKLTVVKLMSPDGYVLIKLITSDNSLQTVYSVCELPTHMMSR